MSSVPATQARSADWRTPTVVLVCGGLGGVIGKGSPVPVWVVNNGPMPGDVPTSGPKSRLASAARTGLRVAGPVAAAAAVHEGIRAVVPSYLQGNDPYGAGGAAVRNQAAGTLPAPGFGGGMPGAIVVQPTVHTDTYLDGGILARTTHVADARKRARK